MNHTLKHKQKKTFKNYQSGFTLLEVLVVISIITLISSIVISNVQVAREKAYDNKRNLEAGALSQAIDLFYQDKGYYPTTTAQAVGVENPEWKSQIGSVLQGYISGMPNLTGGSAVSLIGNSYKTGRYIYVNISGDSQHFKQLYLPVTTDGINVSQYVCFKDGSYLIGTWADRDQSYRNTWTALTDAYGNYYLVNYMKYGGNISYLPNNVGQVLSNCPIIVNP